MADNEKLIEEECPDTAMVQELDPEELSDVNGGFGLYSKIKKAAKKVGRLTGIIDEEKPKSQPKKEEEYKIHLEFHDF